MPDSLGQGFFPGNDPETEFRGAPIRSGNPAALIKSERHPHLYAGKQHLVRKIESETVGSRLGAAEPVPEEIERRIERVVKDGSASESLAHIRDSHRKNH